MTKTEFNNKWNEAKQLFNKDFRKLDNVIQIFEFLVSYKNLDKIILDRNDYATEKEYLSELNYNKALLLGDYSGALCFAGNFKKALIVSDKALFYKNYFNDELSEFSLQYILLNRGTIHLFMKEYKKSMIWFDKILFNEKINKILIENIISLCHTYKGIAFFFLENFNESEKELLRAKEMISSYKNFEPFFFLSKIYEIKKYKKLAIKYKKMFLTRKRKITNDWFKNNMQFYPIEINDLE